MSVEFLGPNGWVPIAQVKEITLDPLVAHLHCIGATFHMEHRCDALKEGEEQEFCIEWDEREQADQASADVPAEFAEQVLEVGIKITSEPIMEREGTVVRYRFKGITEL